jgi:hypothetical protein
MSEIGDSMIKGMEEALDFAKGITGKAIIHIPEDINARCICKIPNAETLETFKKTDAGQELTRHVDVDDIFSQ